MQVFEAARTMLAVRKYTDQPVPDQVIHKIVEAARLTASSKNRQDWHFIVISDPDQIEELGERARYGRYVGDSAFTVAVLLGEYSTAQADAGRVIQQMMLTAWAEGIGSNWVGGADTPEMRTFLNVPDQFEVLALVPFGYPQETLGAGIKNRKSLDEVCSLGRFGVPLNL